MKKEDVKLGMRVVPHRKTIGSILTYEHRQAAFMYVVQLFPEDVNRFGLSLINDYVVDETCFFQVSDFEPFRARREFCKPMPPFDFEECGTIREGGLDMLKEYCGAKHSRFEAMTAPTEEELKERLENKELKHSVLMEELKERAEDL